MSPKAVISDILMRVFEMKSVLQKVVATMAVATLAALGLVITLSVRMRRREFEIANQIGAARSHAILLVMVEMALLLLVALIASLAIASVANLFYEDALRAWIVLR